ncbi:hypothetical protein FGF1_03310 [Flavobacteriaceae bacterium GF1]
MKWIFYLLVFLPWSCFPQNTGNTWRRAVENSRQQAGQGSPELYTVNNALATGANEADDTFGLSPASGAGLASAITPTPQDGSFVLVITETSAPDRMEETVNLTDGVTYIIGYWAWSDTANGGRSQLWTGFTSSPNQFYTTTPTYYEHILTASGTTQLMRWYVQISGSEVYVDGLSIKEQ